MIDLQSLFFQIRTIREDLAISKRQHAQAAARAAAQAAEATKVETDSSAQTVALNGDAAGRPGTPIFPPGIQQQTNPALQPSNNGVRHSWEHVDEIMAILKTAFPLLALSMEMIVDQISTRFKPSPDEDIYRLISALMTDALQVSATL